MQRHAQTEGPTYSRRARADRARQRRTARLVWAAAATLITLLAGSVLA